MKKQRAELTPIEKMRARGESIILLRGGHQVRRAVRDPDTDPHLVFQGGKLAVRRLDPPRETKTGLPIEWEEA